MRTFLIQALSPTKLFRRYVLVGKTFSDFRICLVLEKWRTRDCWKSQLLLQAIKINFDNYTWLVKYLQIRSITVTNLINFF